MSTIVKTEGVPLRVWAPPHEIESDAMRQLKLIAGLPWVVHHVAVMPDVHLGKGATVGAVIAMRDAVAPAAVGVDIGCGMLAARTNLVASELPDQLGALRASIEGAVPVHAGPPKTGSVSLPGAITAKVTTLLQSFKALKAPVNNLLGRAELQLGTLGGGNHFIELCLDQEDRLWVQLHSGSRNVGATLAEFHMARARRLAHNRALPDPDLAAFLAGTPEFEAYRDDLDWAQAYAELNREVMLARLGQILRRSFPRVRLEISISSLHNYVAEERHFGENLLVTRKGAIHAPTNRLGIIPGSMGTKTYIVRGLGNPLAFESASHGAGRRMSRRRARSAYTLRDFEHQTRGVECRKDRALIDEAPKAYKNIERVMDQQKDLVEIQHELRPILCVKG